MKLEDPKGNGNGNGGGQEAPAQPEEQTAQPYQPEDIPTETDPGWEKKGHEPEELEER